MSQEGDCTVGNRILTIGVCFLFLLGIFSTGCFDKKEGDNTNSKLRATDPNAGPTVDVSSGLKVQHMEGYVNQTEGSITDIRVYIALHAGTDALDIINDLFIHVTWTDHETGNNISGDADLLETNNSAVDSLDVNVFVAESIVDPHGSFQNSGLLDQDSIVVLNISTRELQRPPANADFGDDNGLDASSSGTLKLIFSSGVIPTIRGFNVPWSFPEEGGWVELY